MWTEKKGRKEKNNYYISGHVTWDTKDMFIYIYTVTELWWTSVNKHLYSLSIQKNEQVNIRAMLSNINNYSDMIRFYFF